MNRIPEIETQSRESVKVLQEQKLNQTLQYVLKRSPYYKKIFQKSGVSSNTYLRLEDLANLPVTTKDDLQNYNWDFLCVPLNEIVEYTSTSGTLGKPVTLALTVDD